MANKGYSHRKDFAISIAMAFLICVISLCKDGIANLREAIPSSILVTFFAFFATDFLLDMRKRNADRKVFIRGVVDGVETEYRTWQKDEGGIFISAVVDGVETKCRERQKDEGEIFLKKVEDKIEERVGTILEYSALHSEKLEETLKKLRNTSEKRKWIIAKFISRKLSDDFSSELEIEIDGDSYSNFSKNLYSECEDSIFLTSPFTPEDWFRALKLDEETLRKIKKGKNNVITDEILSSGPHVKALLNSPADIKRRLVILSPKDWGSLNAKENLSYLEKFIEVNKGIDTCFVRIDELKDNIALSKGIDFEEFDYAIFDKNLLLRWKKPPKDSPHEKMPLRLNIKIPDDREKLLDTFDFDAHGFYKTGEKIIDEIKKENP